MRKTIALVLAAVMCVFVFAACDAGSAEASTSPDADQASAEATAEASEESTQTAEDADESAEPTESAAETASADEAESSAAGDETTSDTVADEALTDEVLSMFFGTWAEKFQEITSSEGAQKLGVGSDEDVASLLEQAQDWKSHQTDGIATIETSSGDVKISADGSNGFQQASVDWKLSVDALTSQSTPDLLTFTLASAAMVETVAGGDTNGLVQVNDIMSSVLGTIADAGEDIVKGEPLNIGDGLFSVSIDTQTGTMSIVGTPTAD